MQVIERLAEYYDVQEMEFGRGCRWCPERLVVECKCGKRASHNRAQILGGEVTTCECGEDDMSRIREEVVVELVAEDVEEEATRHPWRYWHPSAEDSGTPF